MSNQALRRAAILIASLDTQSADALLDEMASEQAALVRNAVMQLGDIDIVEQQEVIGQFVGRDSQTPSTPDAGVEIDPDLARKFGDAPTARDTNLPGAAQDDFSLKSPVTNNTSQSDVEPTDPQSVVATGPQSVVATGPMAVCRREETRPFAFLSDVDTEDLARVLAGEHPQTTATVVANLATTHAAEVLAQLPLDRQSETLMRIARLTPPHPEVLSDLEQEMEGLLANRRRRDQVDKVGLATVEAILNNTPATARQGLVAQLAQQDTELVNQLRLTTTDLPADATPLGEQPTAMPFDRTGLAGNGVTGMGPLGQNQDTPASSGRYPTDPPNGATQPPMDFATLERLDGSALALVLRNSSSNTTLLALAGASHQFVQRILAQLPKRDATRLERKIQQIGPLRLDDVQRAQQQLAAIAQQLIDEGKLNTSETPRLSVAA